MALMPDKVIAGRVFLEGRDLLGVADVQLPEIEFLSEAAKGAGIGGEVDLPVLGHISAMSVTLNWKTTVKSLIQLAEPKAHMLDIRVSQQSYDSAEGKLKTQAIKHVVKVIPKKLVPGKIETGSPADASNEFSVTYYKMIIDGQAVVEIDPFNYICMINGVDYLSDVRKDLGV